MTRSRVFLHVGSPKTGTTFLQDVLWSQRELAQKQGLLLPLHSFHDHFLASADVRELSSQERYPERAAGIWDKVVEEGRAWKGNVLVSHELFAAATAEQAERAVRAWGDADVHVIVTARDLERQIPAEWQEHLKHRSAMTFTAFVEALRANDAAGSWFWTVQDYADVCRRWGAAVPAPKIHVVTVPGRGAPHDLLWKRFASLVGLDPASFDVVSSRANTSLRAEQAEVLRRINRQLGERLPLPGAYPAIVKEVLAQDVLAGRPGLSIALSGDNRTFAAKRSEALVLELQRLGVDVVGDLAELIPVEDSPGSGGGDTEHPEAISETVLLAESVEALAGLLDRFNRDREATAEAMRPQHRLQSELDRVRNELNEVRAHNEKLLHDMQYRPLRHLVIGASERHPRLMRLRVGYWRAADTLRRITRRRPRT